MSYSVDLDLNYTINVDALQPQYDTKGDTFMKKTLCLILAVCMMLLCLAACSSGKTTDADKTDAASNETTQPDTAADSADTAEDSSEDASSDTAVDPSTLKVGLVCGTSSIDDKSFIQSAWEGLQKASADYGIEVGYLQSTEDSTTAVLESIADLVDAGYNMLVMPGFSFKQAAYEAENKYPDVMFVTIDTAPWAEGADTYTITDNTVAIDFDAEQGGFLAGFGAAVQLKEGSFGGLFGVETDHTTLFITGFKQGVIYANENYDCNIHLNDDNFVWSGTYSDAALGQQIAAQMYESGVNLIYAAAGSTSLGAFNEAKTRAENGESVWVIGCDSDQYGDGLLSDGKTSVTMTTTMKQVGNSAYYVIQQYLDGNYPGGEYLVLDVASGALGCPEVNPNFSEETQKLVDEMTEKIASGEYVVSKEMVDVSAWN